MAAEFAIGIDLGTTNSVVAFAALAEAESPEVQLLDIPQLVAAGTVEARPHLPSFLYLPTPQEEFGALPWKSKAKHVVGEYARRQSAEVPDRTIGAAKSWLAHHRVDRHQPILPWNAPADVPKISPVAASTAYLEHLVAAWNQQHPKAPLAKQQVVLTVPASFDASARELTREAALQAGFPEDFVLLEEPQAALYAWLHAQGDQWRKVLKVGDTILVVDVGGGTTDLTLVTVADEGGDLELRRVAVGNHLLVGGDNMDLTLAHRAAQLFAEQGTHLDPWQAVSLWHSCRAAKENLLGPAQSETQTVSVLGRGKKLIGGSVSVELQQAATRQLLLDGFLPASALDELPQRLRASGFQELGLPFETDTGITRHIAEFLSLHAEEGTAGPIRPTDVLVNGGVFKAEAISARLFEVLANWFPDAPPQPLRGERDLDNAVARGAAYYGWSKQVGGVRIRGGTARSYYVGIETAGLAIPGMPRPLRALCVVPKGMEEGTAADVPSQEFGLIVGTAAQFRFFCSAVRGDDQPGLFLSHWSPEELVEIAPLDATLSVEDGSEGHSVPVTFQSRITELGVFELWCVAKNSDQRWKLEFSVREPE